MSSTVRIFLASSSELAAERAAIEIRVNRINKQLQPRGVFLHLEIWEDFIDTVSRARKQDDYNAAIRQCDLFVILVHHWLGKYSAEEFETAHTAFMDSGRPLILVYLKDPPAPRDPDPSSGYDTVPTFRRRLAEIDHFPTPYHHVAELLDHFTQQIEKLRAEGGLGQDGDGEDGKRPPMVIKTQAASNRGVNIGGSNSGEVRTGDTRIVTGGGAYFAGPVTVRNGNLVGRDHHETHTHAAAAAHADAGDFADVIAALRQVIAQHAHASNQPLGNEMVDALASEVAKPADERSDKYMARLLAGMIDLVPAGIKALTAILLSPALSGLAGSLTKAVLDKLRGGAAP